jgi:hypothetical protein
LIFFHQGKHFGIGGDENILMYRLSSQTSTELIFTKPIYAELISTELILPRPTCRKQTCEKRICEKRTYAIPISRALI